MAQDHSVLGLPLLLSSSYLSCSSNSPTWCVTGTVWACGTFFFVSLPSRLFSSLDFTFFGGGSVHFYL